MNDEDEYNHANMKAPWRDEAACLSTAMDVDGFESAWITEDHPARAEAAGICMNDCEVRNTCLLTALLDPTAEGMRGGFWFTRGALTRKDRNKFKREFPEYAEAAKINSLEKIAFAITNAGQMVS